MRGRSRKGVFLAGFFCAMLVAGFMLVAAQHVFAATAGNTGPSPSVTSYRTSNGAAANPKYVLVRSPNTGDMSTMEIPLYYDSETAPTSDFILAITAVRCGNQSSCGGTAPHDDDPGNNQRLEITTRVGTENRLLGRVRGGTVTVPRGAFIWHEETQTYRAILTMQLRNGNNNHHPSNVWRNRITFRLEISQPATDAYIGNAVGGSDSYVNLIAENPNEDPVGYTYEIYFATPCTVTTPVQKTIELYDLDHNNADNSGMNVSVGVRDTDTNGTVSIDTSGSRGDRSSYYVTMSFQPRHRYVLTVRSIAPINMVQYRLPFDSINSERTCGDTEESEPLCAASTLPSRASVGEEVRFTASVKPGMSATGAMRLSMDITGPRNINFGNVAYAVSGSGAGTLLTSASQSFTPTQDGQYTLTWHYTNGTQTKDCPATINVGRQPYFIVSGGDIMAGGSITAYNRNSGGYQGAGAQLAAIATGNLEGFITGSDGLGGARPGSRLAFANEGIIVGGVYGGNFASLPTRTIPAAISTSTTPVRSSIDLAATSSGTYILTDRGSLFGTLQPNQKITVIAQGDVYVSGLIGYSYASIVEIPHLTVIANNGNILISRSVGEIRGSFYASGGDDDNGIFYSCALSPSQPVDGNSLGSHISDCGSRLNVRGMVSASKFVLARTSSGWSSASPVPAEDFSQGPESWLGGGDNDYGFDSYISLPPVL